MHDNIFIKPYVILKKVCLPSVWLDGWFSVIWERQISKTLVKDITEEMYINIWTFVFPKYSVCIATTLPVFSGDKVLFVDYLSK